MLKKINAVLGSVPHRLLWSRNGQEFLWAGMGLQGMMHSRLMCMVKAGYLSNEEEIMKKVFREEAYYNCC